MTVMTSEEEVQLLRRALDDLRQKSQASRARLITRCKRVSKESSLRLTMLRECQWRVQSLEAELQRLTALRTAGEAPPATPLERWALENRVCKLTPAVLLEVWKQFHAGVPPKRIAESLGVGKEAVVAFATGWSNTAAAMFTYQQLGVTPEWVARQNLKQAQERRKKPPHSR